MTSEQRVTRRGFLARVAAVGSLAFVRPRRVADRPCVPPAGIWVEYTNEPWNTPGPAFGEVFGSLRGGAE